MNALRACAETEDRTCAAAEQLWMNRAKHATHAYAFTQQCIASNAMCAAEEDMLQEDTEHIQEHPFQVQTEEEAELAALAAATQAAQSHRHSSVSRSAADSVQCLHTQKHRNRRKGLRKQETGNK